MQNGYEGKQRSRFTNPVHVISKDHWPNLDTRPHSFRERIFTVPSVPKSIEPKVWCKVWFESHGGTYQWSGKYLVYLLRGRSCYVAHFRSHKRSFLSSSKWTIVWEEFLSFLIIRDFCAHNAYTKIEWFDQTSYDRFRWYYGYVLVRITNMAI